MPHEPREVYIGDGLYVSYDGYQVELYASDGQRKTNQVFLEPVVLNAFLKYVTKLKETQHG